MKVPNVLKSRLRQFLQPDALPGWEAHQLACPPGRPKDLPQRIETARRAGVVCLLCWEAPKGWGLVLMKRTQDGSPHSGQWAFPGGAEEACDEGDLERTARRECHEEIGVLLNDVEVMGALSPLYIPPSHFFVQPIVAVAEGPLAFVLQEEEVAEVCVVPLSDLPEAGRPWKAMEVRVKHGRAHAPGCAMKEGVLWGATAMMTAELLEVCARAGFGRSFADENDLRS